MRISSLLVAVGSVAVFATSTFASFTVKVVANGAPVSGRQRYDLLAFNDGLLGTGTKLQAVNLTYTTLTGTKVYFGVQDLLPVDGDGAPVPDGVNDSVNLYNNPSVQPSTSQLRFGSAPGATTASNPTSSDHTYQDFNPSTDQNAAGTPYEGGLTAFHGAYAVLGASAPIANGTGGGAATGAAFGRLFVTAGGTFTLTGTIAGDQGVAVPFTASNVTVPEPTSLLAIAGAAGFGMIRRRK